MTKLISIVTPCFNEEENIDELYQRIADVMATQPYDYEHIFIDNCSTDDTVTKIKEIAKYNKHVKLIVNARNFGHIKSPYYAILQSRGDACILLASDLQDPPEMIAEFIKKWEEGFKIVLAEKAKNPRACSFLGKLTTASLPRFQRCNWFKILLGQAYLIELLSTYCVISRIHILISVDFYVK